MKKILMLIVCMLPSLLVAEGEDEIVLEAEIETTLVAPEPEVFTQTVQTETIVRAVDFSKLIETAVGFERSMHDYFNAKSGRKEYELKNDLREKFLGCGASFEELSARTRAFGDEVSRRFQEWNALAEQGQLERSEGAHSVKEVVKAAKKYNKVYTKASKERFFREYVRAHDAFKQEVEAQLASGVEPEEMVAALKKEGVTHGRVLSRPAHWNQSER